MSNKAKLTEAPDGNIFSILGACSKALRRHNKEQHEAFQKETQAAMQDGETDYDGMLRICMKYVDFEFECECDEDEDESYD